MESAHKRQRIAVAGATGGVGRHVVGVLTDRGHDVLAISRCVGVDVITGEGLDAALADVPVIMNTATGPSAEQGPATSSLRPRLGTSRRPASEPA